ncbi:uncharacterized protein N7503_008433 [Penicillium pulvis]|uniref:uncharacterized protein n=1 Tax=Penicillium pulvis TaxID=1562058 RepID=UPI0025465B79|nr:uncharacterized protein N7503_008433 [Penicillium pulvis]KAJ5792455.1 hypothetical protein N7503_008433 [Penicillium pulvis]
MANPFRQLPGLACEECRRRKARAQRGPKKGQIRALRNRVHTLERLVSEQKHPEQSFATATDAAVTVEQMEPSPEITSTEIPPIWDLDAILPPIFEPFLTELRDQHLPHISSTTEGSSYGSQANYDDQISVLVRDDLVSVYFERVHPNIPIIHKQRYFDMIEQQSLSKSQNCLQLAVQAAAAASTAQLLELSATLYEKACAALETVEINGSLGQMNDILIELEYVQALLLIAYYEALRLPQYKCILTSGRAFRLTQLLRLHEIDKAAPLEPVLGDVFVREEERRRTFWMAYCFDRLLSIRHELPLTLHEEALPNPVSRTADRNPVDFCTEHQEIRECLQHRMQTMSKHIPVSAAVVDSTLSFAHILACNLMIDLNEVAEGMALGMDEHQKSVTICLPRALDACKEIVRLAKSSARLAKFKAHVFLPALLSRTMGFLSSHNPHAQSNEIDELISVLQVLRCMNRQAEELVYEWGDVTTQL